MMSPLPKFCVLFFSVSVFNSWSQPDNEMHKQLQWGGGSSYTPHVGQTFEGWTVQWGALWRPEEDHL